MLFDLKAISERYEVASSDPPGPTPTTHRDHEQQTGASGSSGLHGRSAPRLHRHRPQGEEERGRRTRAGSALSKSSRVGPGGQQRATGTRCESAGSVLVRLTRGLVSPAAAMINPGQKEVLPVATARWKWKETEGWNGTHGCSVFFIFRSFFLKNIHK